jgi:hypothetical protein
VDIFLNDKNWTMFPDRYGPIFSNQISYTKKMDRVWQALHNAVPSQPNSDYQEMTYYRLTRFPPEMIWGIKKETKNFFTTL